VNVSRELLANIFTFGTLTQWIVIAFVYFGDAIRVHLRTKRAYRLALKVGNGGRRVMRSRIKTSRKHLAISFTASAVGVAVVYRWIYLPHPPPDTQIYSMVTTEGIILILFLMWRIKRDALNLIRQTDQYALDHRQMDHVEATTTDTNVRVREMQERGQSDQIEEQADRQAGRDHRHSE
jgi:hypothetical protein